MTDDNKLEDKMVSNIPKSVLAIGGSLLCLSLALNLVGIYLGPAINDWMKFKIEQAKNESACELKAIERVKNFEKRIDLLQKRFERVEKLAHKKTQ